MTVRNIDALLRPQRVLVLGSSADGIAGQVLHNIAHTVPSDRRTLVGANDPGWCSIAEHDPWPATTVAVLMDLRYATASVVRRLADCGCRALVWPLAAAVPDELWEAARASTLRVLGPRGGLSCAAGPGYSLSSLPLQPQAGNVALIAQSHSVAAAAVDWMLGRNLGLSWLAITGGEADVDVADLLDHAALDPQTRAVALQLGRVRCARKFMSAARAVARIKPVAVLQTQPIYRPGGDAAVRSAAFRRAGLVECVTLGGLFDAIAALSRLPVPADGRIAVVGNGAGGCALAVDALHRQGLAVASLPAEIASQLGMLASQSRIAGGAVDLGDAGPAATVQALQLLLALPAVDAALYVHSPASRGSHEEMARALVGAGLREHLLTVWLGLQTAVAARGISALGGIATFPSADEAARALRYRRQHRLTRELLMQTPPPVSAARIRATEATALLAGLPDHAAFADDVAARLLACYGIAMLDRPAGLQVEVIGQLDAELGMHLRIATRAPGLASREAIGFAPLDPLLAGRMLQEAGVDAGESAAGPLAELLVALAQLLLDQPRLGRLRLLLGVDGRGRAGLLPGSARGECHPPQPERQRLPLAAYPEHLGHELLLGRTRLMVRPVRAADEPAVVDLLQRLDPEEVRLRFFLQIRSFSHDMAARMTQVDYDRELSLVALPTDQPQRIVAMATLIIDPDGARAEFAVLVHHDWAGRGVGRHLMQSLLAFARDRAIHTVHGDVLADNAPMLALARSLGFESRRDPEDAGCMLLSLQPGGAHT